MDHQDAKELFSEHLDGDLTDAQSEQLRQHLDGCEECRSELAALEQTLKSLAALSPVKPPPDFERQVQQRIRRRSRGRFFQPESLLSRLPFEWISFVIIMLMLLMYFMLVQQGGRVHPREVIDAGTRAPAASRPVEPTTRPVEPAPR